VSRRAEGDAFHGPPLAVNTPHGRAYKHPETGDYLPSITTVLKVIDKPALVGWAARETAGAAFDQRHALVRMNDREAAVDMLKNARYRSMNKAGDVGSLVHRVAEALERDEPLPVVTDAAAPYVESFVAFVAAFEPQFEIVEGTVFSDTWGYAGTFDFLARFDDLLVLGDHKTGKGVYPEVALQIAAARYADRVWNRDTGELTPMPEVAGAIAVHLHVDGYRVVEIDAGRDAFEAFVAARQLWPWAHDGGDNATAIGPSLSPQRLARTFGQVSA
jgi:hypothetical protein